MNFRATRLNGCSNTNRNMPTRLFRLRSPPAIMFHLKKHMLNMAKAQTNLLKGENTNGNNLWNGLQRQ